MTATITIPAQFNGPPTSANGGYCAGLAARLLGEPVTVTLRAPPPLDTPIRVDRSGDGADFYHGDVMVMTARAGTPVATPPAPPTADSAALGPATYPGLDEHKLNSCFVCGPARETGDGLRIFAGSIPGTDYVAAPWTPHPGFAAGDGLIPEEIVWAALDCPGAFALDAEFCLLGRMTARIDRRPEPGEPLIVVGWATGSDGRKHGAATALFTESGDLLAQADQLWIEVRGA